MAQAAGSKIQLEDVKQTVTCGICLQLYTDPRVLTCEHTYCLICLQGFQTSSSKSKNCPVCREKTIPIKQDLDGLPENELAKQLVMLVHTYEPETKGKPEQNTNNFPTLPILQIISGRYDHIDIHFEA